jgi:drug/metabolite transporter (DMT)-like permease
MVSQGCAIVKRVLYAPWISTLFPFFVWYSFGGSCTINPMKQETRWTLLILFAFLVWGSFFPVSRYIVADVHPLLLAFLRYFFAVLPMLPFFLLEVRRSGMPSLVDTLHLCLLGALGVTAFAVLLFYGLKLSNSMLSSILNNTQPIFATLLAPLFTSERFTRRQFGGILLGMGGTVLVITGGDFSAITSGDSLILGNLMSVTAALSISMYYILLKKLVKRYGTIIPTFISFLSGGLLLLGLTLFSGADLTAISRLGALEWSFVLYNGIIATALVYIIHNKAMSIIGVIKTIRLKFLIPVFGVLLSMIFLGERGSLFIWIGLAVVLIATFIIQFPSGTLAPLWNRSRRLKK